MDGLTAKRIFIALARKFSYASVRRCNFNHGYKLKFISSSGYAGVTLGYIDAPDAEYDCILTFNSAKWVKMLQDLEGKTLVIGSECLKVLSIEQLIIDLQLQGYLRSVK